jgi:hypothetical protein
MLVFKQLFTFIKVWCSIGTRTTKKSIKIKMFDTYVLFINMNAQGLIFLQP